MSVLLAVWAVAFAAAQEHFVVAVGETRSYFVEEHAGSEYVWTVTTNQLLPFMPLQTR